MHIIICSIFFNDGKNANEFQTGVSSNQNLTSSCSNLEVTIDIKGIGGNAYTLGDQLKKNSCPKEL